MHTIVAVWHLVAPWLAWACVVLGIVNALARRIPQATVVQWERHRPRLANSLRIMRAIGPDVGKALPVLYVILRGVPWPPAIDRIIAAFLVPPAEAAAATATAPVPTPTPPSTAPVAPTGGSTP